MALNQREVFAEAANGHTWATALMLQATCTKCGYVAAYQSAKSLTVPPCSGRVAQAVFGGHRFEYAGDTATCTACDQAFPSYIPLGQERTWTRDIDTPPGWGGVEYVPLPACQRCDHKGALEEVKAKDPRWAAWGIGAGDASRPRRLYVCAACGTRRLLGSDVNGT